MFTNIIKLIMGMMKQYFEELNKYKKQYGEKVLLLWQCGHFFEIYALKDIKNNVYVDPNIIDFGNICDYLVKPKQTNTKGGKKAQKHNIQMVAHIRCVCLVVLFLVTENQKLINLMKMDIL